MYCDYFGLKDYPFLSTADRRFFYLSESQAKARDYLSYLLVLRDGIVVVTGEPGVGKSVLVDQAITNLPDKVHVAHLNQTLLTHDEFLLSLCTQLGCIPECQDKPKLYKAIHDFAMDRHLELSPVLLIIDEAQNLSPNVLEEIRLLANLEMFGRKLIQVILLGQPELAINITALPGDAFSQVVRLNHQLEPLSRDEICEYIDYRLYVAGNDGRLVFPKELIDGILCYTGGIPRLVNQLCDMMLVTAFINKTDQIDNYCLHSAIQKLAWPLYIERKSELLSRYNANEMVEMRPLPLLTVYKHDVIVGKYLLNKKRMLIGRQKNLDVFIDEPRSSRIHAQIIFLDGQFFIHDLNSMNGTHLGEKRIKWHAISDNEVFRIGQHTLKYQISDDEVAEAPEEVLPREPAAIA
ncbi:MAG: AAA family ATPase [Thioalkalispiraceae bacterium]|jgi:type II secretory pathway predicted ATPase ExeA